MKAVVNRRASTLVELLLAISILTIVAGFTLAALNPDKTFDDTNDAKRRDHLRIMIEALYQYQIDHGQFALIPKRAYLDQSQRDVCSLTSIIPNDLFFCSFDVPQRIPLGQLIPDYLPALPHDPENTEQYETGYQLWVDADGRIHAYAPLGDGGNGIELAR